MPAARQARPRVRTELPANSRVAWIIDLQTAATDRGEQSMDTFAIMLKPGYKEHPQVPKIVGEAIIGGLWNVIQHEVGHGRAGQLPQLTPELTYIALTPFLGAGEAARIATGSIKG